MIDMSQQPLAHLIDSRHLIFEVNIGIGVGLEPRFIVIVPTASIGSMIRLAMLAEIGRDVTDPQAIIPGNPMGRVSMNLLGNCRIAPLAGPLARESDLASLSGRKCDKYSKSLIASAKRR